MPVFFITLKIKCHNIMNSHVIKLQVLHNAPDNIENISGTFKIYWTALGEVRNI